MEHGMYKRLVLKVGSNVLSGTDGAIDMEVMQKICHVVALLKEKGVEVVLVSSGAVASGRNELPLPEDTPMVAKRQLWASVGQIKLMQTYLTYFSQHKLHCGQILVTKEDFRDKGHYINMKNCILAMLQQGIVPVVNENDVVSVTELMFTDNDELAGLLATMTDADALILMTNVNGIFTGDPTLPDSKRIPFISLEDKHAGAGISASKSSFGRGGMLTKYKIAKKVASQGIFVHVVHGKQPMDVLALVEGKRNGEIGTTFLASRKTNATKKRIAFSEGFAQAKIIINSGAVAVLRSDKARSLLPVGVVGVDGSFEKGDIVQLVQENGEVVGVGMAAYSSQKLEDCKGKKQQKEIIHYDYLYLFPF